MTAKEAKAAAYTREMNDEDTFYAVAEAAAAGPVPLRIFRGTKELSAVQLAEALDNPELLAGNWELLDTRSAASTSTADLLASVGTALGDATAAQDSAVVGNWKILMLQRPPLPGSGPEASAPEEGTGGL